MADCLNCKNNIRTEIYDGQWGMFYFQNMCSLKVCIIKDGKINPWDATCNKFEYGEPKIEKMTKEEKQSYLPGYYEDAVTTNDIIQDIIISPEISNNDKITKTEELLQKYNKTIYTKDGKYKPVVDVLEVISEIWNNNLK